MLVPAKPTYKALRGGAQAKNHKFDILAAPNLGLDVSQPLAVQDPRAALFAQNFIFRRSGPETRPGFRRWTTNLGGIGTESVVATLMAYNPPRGVGSAQVAKLFSACADQKIYDVTSQTSEATVPAAAVTVGGTQVEPGEWSYINFSTAGTNYLCAVCSSNGAFSYWTYDDAGGWVNRTASITGTAGAVNSFDFIMAWKNRLWFVARNSNIAWFLPVGVVQGAASPFDFGPLLLHGGEIRAMASWTLDAGDGVDDKLVIIGSMGDVLVYDGTDPTSISTFAIVGRWYVGRPPQGRKFITKYGGDVAILSENGVEYMSRLISSRGLMDPQSQDETAARRYVEVIGNDIRDTMDQGAWQLIYVPSEASAIVKTNRTAYTTGAQYCYSSVPMAWSTFKAMPINCMEVFKGELYFGTTGGRVCKAFSASTDDQLFDGTLGTEVEAEIQGTFVAPFNDPMSLKRPLLIMPMFQAAAAPSIKAKINTEWSGDATSGSPSFVPANDAIWNASLWDSAIWGGGGNSYFLWIGAEGLGTHLSIRVAIRGAPRTKFTSWKVVYEPGGIM